MRVTLQDKAGEREFEVVLGPDDEQHRVRAVVRGENGEESLRSVKRFSGPWKRAVDAAKIRQAEQPESELDEGAEEVDQIDPAEPPTPVTPEPVEPKPANDYDQPPTETWVVRFEDHHHHNLHQVLQGAGFTFELNSDFQVGRRYVHPKKLIEVWLEMDPEDDTDFLDCKVMFRNQVQTHEDYSEAEWNWFNQPDTPDGVVEQLRRELHILINIRPHYMSGDQIAITG